VLKGPESSENHHGRSARHTPLTEARRRCRQSMCDGILWLFKASMMRGRTVAEGGLMGSQIVAEGGYMGSQTVAEGGLMGEEAEEAAGLKLAAGLAMAESFGSCSGACNRSPIA
jgi:hypothetical protein